MSNKSVLGTPNTSHKRNSTAFSVSRDFTFTAAPGMLLPVYRKFLNIGEKVKGNPKFFLRTNPLLAPSMTDIDVYVENFFVPMRHIYSMFEQWFTQVDDANSDLYTSENWANTLPVLGVAGSTEPFKWMTSSLFDTRINHGYQDTLDAHSFTFGFDLHRLTNMLGYNAQALFTNCSDPSTAADYGGIRDVNSIKRIVQNNSSPSFSPYFYAAYQKIYYDIYRDTEFETNNVLAYNMDSYFNTGTAKIDPTDGWNGRPWGGQKSRLGMFQLRYRNRNKDYFTAIHPAPLFNTIGFLPNAIQNTENITNWLTTGVDSYVLEDYKSLSVKTVDDVTVGSSLKRYSLGDVITSGGSSGQVTYALQSGKYSLAGSDGSSFRSFNHDHEVVSNSYINLASMRTAFAIDKLMTIMNNAGRHVDDQLFALFGVKLPKGVDNEVYRIKSYHTMVHLGEVISTAQTQITDGDTTSVTPLGEMAGRGIAVLNSNDSFTFTAPCPGIIMSIFSIAPRYKYIGALEKDGFRFNLNEFFKPQYDNLGKQPLFGYEIGYYNNEMDLETKRLGWQYFNMQDKINFDKASIAFVTNGDTPWCFSTAAPYYNASSDYTYEYAFNKISPSDLNPLFVAEYDGVGTYPAYTGGEDTRLNYCRFPVNYLRDPFKVDFSMDMYYFSEMSRFGEPQLGGI